MKLLPLLVEPIPHVRIARCLDQADPASLALDKLVKVQPMLEGYAKEKNVDLFVHRTAKNETHVQPQYVRNITDNIISLVVQNRDGSNRQMTNFVVHPWKDSYTYKKIDKVELIQTDGSKVKRTTASFYEDNFLRAFFRTFENLVKVVKTQD